MEIKLQHPYIRKIWLKYTPTNDNKDHRTLVVETNLRGPDKNKGFTDGRLPDLLQYLSEATRPHRLKLTDIEIRTLH
jgi:hypothetical protein